MYTDCWIKYDETEIFNFILITIAFYFYIWYLIFLRPSCARRITSQHVKIYATIANKCANMQFLLDDYIKIAFRVRNMMQSGTAWYAIWSVLILHLHVTPRLIVWWILCCRTCPMCALGPAWGPLRNRSVWGLASPAPPSPSRVSFGTRLKEVRTLLRLNSPIYLRELRIRPFYFLFSFLSVM